MEKEKLVRFNDFYNAYAFLREHPINYIDRKQGDDSFFSVNHFNELLDVDVVKVNPNHIENGSCICDFNEKDTKTEVWLEYGSIAIHDFDLIKMMVKGINDDFIEEIKEHIVFSSDGPNYGKPTFEDFVRQQGYDPNQFVICTHNINLDCGGDTFEEAIINLANLVYNEYPEYRYYDVDEMKG